MKGAIDSRTIQECLEKVTEMIKNSDAKPDLYHTNCVNCGQALLMPCWIKAETCPMCEVRKNQEKK